MSQDKNNTMNGTQPWSCYLNPTAEKIGKTFAYCLIFLVSLAGNTVIGIIVYKTKTMRKPINFLIVNMAMSDLLIPILLIPTDIQLLYINSWLIGGPLGEALCKLVSFLPSVSLIVSIQSLVLIAVDRFGAVVFPLRSPLISSKLCPFFILATWIIAMAFFSPYLFAFKLDVEYPGGLVCNLRWKEVFGESSSYHNYLHASFDDILFHPVGVDIHTLHYHLYKAQVTEGSRRAIGQRWTTTPTEGTKCVKDGYCYCVRVCSMLDALPYPLVSRLLCIGHTVLWFQILCPFSLFNGSHKLCHESLYLFNFQ